MAFIVHHKLQLDAESSQTFLSLLVILVIVLSRIGASVMVKTEEHECENCFWCTGSVYTCSSVGVHEQEILV